MEHTTGFAAEPGPDGRHDAHAVEPGATTSVCGEQLDVVVDSDWRTVRVRRCPRCLRTLDPRRTAPAS